tara:strand:+ start:1789 stop:2019 length:231 start_codon:yes stop_codon:yes gene_type:complete
MKERGGKWDGRSRIPDDTYRNNWNDIFGKKEKTESEKLQDNLEPITNNKEDEKKAVQHLNLKDLLVKQLIKERFNK